MRVSETGIHGKIILNEYSLYTQFSFVLVYLKMQSNFLRFLKIQIILKRCGKCLAYSRSVTTEYINNDLLDLV